MKTVRVRPRDDGHDFPQSWMVHVNGKMKSSHTTKDAAKRKAREIASDGDQLVIHRTDGTIQKNITVRDATADSDQSKRQRSVYGTGTIDSAFPW